jgi:hypothetical protein
VQDDQAAGGTPGLTHAPVSRHLNQVGVSLSDLNFSGSSKATTKSSTTTSSSDTATIVPVAAGTAVDNDTSAGVQPAAADAGSSPGPGLVAATYQLGLGVGLVAGTGVEPAAAGGSASGRKLLGTPPPPFSSVGGGGGAAAAVFAGGARGVPAVPRWLLAAVGTRALHGSAATPSEGAAASAAATGASGGRSNEPASSTAGQPGRHMTTGDANAEDRLPADPAVQQMVRAVKGSDRVLSVLQSPPRVTLGKITGD